MVSSSDSAAVDLDESPNAGQRTARPRRGRWAGLARFLLVFLGIVASSHGYFISRLVSEPGWGAPLAGGLKSAVVALGLLLVAMPFATRLVPPGVARPVAFVGYVWMGVGFYLLLGLWTTDLALWAMSAQGPDVARTRALVVVGVAGSLALVGMFNALTVPAVKRVEVAIARLPEALAGFRIVQLSDIHIGALLQRRFARGIVTRSNELEPDVVAITGDVVDGQVVHLAPHVAPFADLQARYGVFMATGNHDHYAGAGPWIQQFERMGVRVLQNEHTVIDAPGGQLVLAGVNDRSASREGDDVDRAFAAATRDAPRVLLAHHPQTFEKAPRNEVDLQLSGHTHGGQMWPFNLLVPLQTKWVAGLYRAGHSQLYVSRGTGFWGPPMRLLAPAEITELVLTPASGLDASAA